MTAALAEEKADDEKGYLRSTLQVFEAITENHLIPLIDEELTKVRGLIEGLKKDYGEDIAASELKFLAETTQPALMGEPPIDPQQMIKNLLEDPLFDESTEEISPVEIEREGKKVIRIKFSPEEEQTGSETLSKNDAAYKRYNEKAMQVAKNLAEMIFDVESGKRSLRDCRNFVIFNREFFQPSPLYNIGGNVQGCLGLLRSLQKFKKRGKKMPSKIRIPLLRGPYKPFERSI